MTDRVDFKKQVDAYRARHGDFASSRSVPAVPHDRPTRRSQHLEFIPSRGLHVVGKQHEIYLSDPRKVALGLLRAILRQPVAA